MLKYYNSKTILPIILPKYLSLYLYPYCRRIWLRRRVKYSLSCSPIESVRTCSVSKKRNCLYYTFLNLTPSKTRAPPKIYAKNKNVKLRRSFMRWTIHSFHCFFVSIYFGLFSAQKQRVKSPSLIYYNILSIQFATSLIYYFRYAKIYYK
jgi:hypothetical protein